MKIVSKMLHYIPLCPGMFHNIINVCVKWVDVTQNWFKIALKKSIAIMMIKILLLLSSLAKSSSESSFDLEDYGSDLEYESEKEQHHRYGPTHPLEASSLTMAMPQVR